MSAMTTKRPEGQIIDTRDLIAWREYASIDSDEEEREDIEAIDAIENAGISDFPYGETLIREDYFTEYARDLAEDIGSVNADAGWPLSYIDWEAAAEALKQDYTTVEWDGSTYYVRA